MRRKSAAEILFDKLYANYYITLPDGTPLPIYYMYKNGEVYKFDNECDSNLAYLWEE